MPFDVQLTWVDTLELAAALSDLARVRSRFLPFGASPPWPKGRSGASEVCGVERTAALARAGLYNFLAVGFAEPPSPDFTDRLYQSQVPALLAEKGLGGDNLRHMGEAVAHDERAAGLARAYTRLLIRPGPDHAPPLASEYLTGAAGPSHPLSLGSVAEAVEAAYREAGLVVSGAGPYPPQHLAIELQFMHHCVSREAAAWGEGSADEADRWRGRELTFLTSHLLPWIGPFFDRVNTCGAHPYYQALAGLTSSFLAFDAQHLAVSRPSASTSGAPSSPGAKPEARDWRDRLGMRAG